eukprot:CAMPEP_0201679904 /NCGR_PEP_ID=MMETSP0494-20130426/49558_1 /ASSEMBLY_ACC=CAM_ASM_000839 /TAXON_ID=420259 /ORGANISM="Thalassiosira gravida, Strain GMp14c1" /LENGTH=205 /DNA_ID=CAMNT_0048163529 /DNA_START=74 /DNA_END=688 /DNA_ORIENTATION=-
MKPSFIFFLATLVGARGACEEKAASTTSVASLNANANLRGISVGSSEERSPCVFPDDTHAAANPPAVTDSLRAIQHATASLPKGEDDKSSCEASGSGCDGGFFCNHPTGDGGTCVMCPVEEVSCEDFGEAVGACERNCFKREADGAPVLDVGTATGYSWCPAGGCCVDYSVDLSSPTLLKENRYACGCGWGQHKIPAEWDSCDYW